MPEPTPERAGLKPPQGALYPSQVLARNLAAVRRLHGWRQEFVSERMMYLGHGWTPATVSKVERGRRNVTVDELFSLALVFEIVIERLLDAHFLFPDLKEPSRKVALVRPTSVAASRAEHESPEMLIDASDLHSVLCGDEVNVAVTWDEHEPWRLIMVKFHDKGEERR
jgi:transcriptional regulator with XRE-family HTH domain